MKRSMANKKIKLGILGADGNMGQLISKLAIEDGGFEIVLANTIPESKNLGKDIGNLVGNEAIGTKITTIKQLQTDLKEKKPQIIIDFTVAKATEMNAPVIIQNGISMVIGTTGMTDEFYGEFEALCEENGVVSVLASNMATGVNIFFKMAKEIAKYVEGWDIEIIEKHHHRKRDSPSGTALTTAKKIAEALGKDLKNVAKYGRNKGPNPRKIGSEEIGIHSVRGGDIVGDHTVLYAGPGERIELIHRAHSRECFASGALKAAKFLIENEHTDTVFDMQDVLNLT